MPNCLLKEQHNAVHLDERRVLPEGALPLSLEDGQRITLEVLDELDAFCRSRDIPYFVIGGSLIGAIRYHDLLPWDDDIDVAMKREDYERFCGEYQDSDAFKLFTCERVEGYRHGMAKLVRRGTLFVESTARDVPFGVFVDIFPLDAAQSPDNRGVSRVYRSVKIYNYAHVINAHATRANGLKNAIRIMLGATVGLFPYKRHFSRIEQRMTSGEGDYLFNYWGAWGKKEHARAESFSSTTDVTIRGKRYLAPVGYQEWLANVYGSYMDPPDEAPHYHGRSYLVQEEGCLVSEKGGSR